MKKRQNVIITGASSGIGRIIAIKLSENYNVILNGRNEDKLMSVLQDCDKEGSHLIWAADLEDTHTLEDKLRTFIDLEDISISHFVHCAGFMKMLPLKLVNLSNLYTTFNTNVFSVALIIKLLVSKKVNKSSLKSAVFISSNISNRGAKAFSSYAASKAALDGLMRCLAIELAPNVRINSVLPGAVQTQMTQSIFENEEVAKRMLVTYPLGLGRPEDVYNAVSFLLSEKQNRIPEHQLDVYGGRIINITG